MIKDMGNGVKDVIINFENPILITQRNSETFLINSNFSNQESLMTERYPIGAFAYSQLNPMIIKFDRPVKLISMYLKMHRHSEFWK